MRNIISEAILTQTWNKDAKPLKKSYGNLKQFLQAVIPKDEMDVLDLRNFYDLFYLVGLYKIFSPTNLVLTITVCI